MKNFVATFDAETDALVEKIRIPPSRKQELYVLMGWQGEEDEMYVHDLSAHQLSVIGGWLGRDLSSASWIAQLLATAD